MNGLCVDGLATYTCTCEDGYDGINCDNGKRRLNCYMLIQTVICSLLIYHMVDYIRPSIRSDLAASLFDYLC